MKVQALEQRLSLTKKNGGRRDVKSVNQAGTQILPHRGLAASYLHVFAAGSVFREYKCLLESAQRESSEYARETFSGSRLFQPSLPI